MRLLATGTSAFRSRVPETELVPLSPRRPGGCPAHQVDTDTALRPQPDDRVQVGVPIEGHLVGVGRLLRITIGGKCSRGAASAKSRLETDQPRRKQAPESKTLREIPS